MTSGKWRSSNRKAELPHDWPRIRREILTRAGHRCEWIEHGARCPARATDVDHVVAGDDHSAGNLRALCGEHHKRKTQADAGAGRARARARLRLPTGRHPGLR